MIWPFSKRKSQSNKDFMVDNTATDTKPQITNTENNNQQTNTQASIKDYSKKPRSQEKQDQYDKLKNLYYDTFPEEKGKPYSKQVAKSAIKSLRDDLGEALIRTSAQEKADPEDIELIQKYINKPIIKIAAKHTNLENQDLSDIKRKINNGQDQSLSDISKDKKAGYVDLGNNSNSGQYVDITSSTYGPAESLNGNKWTEQERNRHNNKRSQPVDPSSAVEASQSRPSSSPLGR